MCWICICIAARLKPYWPMKTTSRSPTGGTHIPRAARSLPRSSLSGFGTCAWSWGKRSRRLNCARPNLLPHVRRNLSQPMNPYLRKHPSLRSLTALRNSRAPLLRMAFPAPLLLRNLMGRSAALPTTRSISRSGVLSGMAPCGCCTRRASVIAVPVPCGHSVKKAAPRSNHDG